MYLRSCQGLAKISAWTFGKKTDTGCYQDLVKILIVHGQDLAHINLCKMYMQDSWIFLMFGFMDLLNVWCDFNKILPSVWDLAKVLLLSIAKILQTSIFQRAVKILSWSCQDFILNFWKQLMQDSSKILSRFCLCLVKILQTSTCSRLWQDLGRNLPWPWQDPSKIKILTRSSKIFHDH